MTEHSKKANVLFMTLAMLGFSLTPIVSKTAIDEVGVYLVQLLRFATIALFYPLAHYMVTDKDRVSLFEVEKMDLFRMFCTSFFLIGSIVTFYYAFEYISVNRALILSLVYPVMTIFLARVFLHEHVKTRDLIAGALTILGLVALFALSNPGPSELLGDILALASAFCSAAYIVLNRYTSLRQLYYKQTFWLFFFGTLMMLPFISYASPISLSSTISVQTVLVLIFLCVVITLIPFTLFSAASRHFRSSAVGFMFLAAQIGSVVMAVVILGETMTSGVLVGGLLLVSASIISAYSFSHVFSFKNYILAKVRNKIVDKFSKKI